MQPWTCVSCGERHEGIFDLAYNKPEFWQGPEDYSPNATAASSTHFLSEDFCVLNDQHYFVRAVLQLPLIGLDGQYFGYGVWTTLSKKNFQLYLESFDSGEQAHLGPWFGWFSNRLKGYPDTLNLKCQVHPQAGRQRPLVELEPTDHPLAIEQKQGIDCGRLMEIYASDGHAPRLSS
jgi:hypothetical protein